MFKKVKFNKQKKSHLQEENMSNFSNYTIIYNENTQNILENDPIVNDINLIKADIDKKFSKKKQKFQFTSNEEKIYLAFKKEENRESTVKKSFISESQLKEAKNPEERKKLLGIKREEYDKLREDKRKGLIDMQKELFTLPDNLQAQPTTKNDHVENLIKLSSAGLIEVPLPLEQKLKSIEVTDNIIRTVRIDNRLSEEIDYLKLIQKFGPTNIKGNKSNLSHKKITKLNNIFENVFVGENSRKRKLHKEKVIMENRKSEQL